MTMQAAETSVRTAITAAPKAEKDNRFYVFCRLIFPSPTQEGP
jgi:hypothetical protein